MSINIGGFSPQILFFTGTNYLMRRDLLPLKLYKRTIEILSNLNCCYFWDILPEIQITFFLFRIWGVTIIFTRFIREGADVVVFGTCLYVGVVTFIREFQCSPFVWTIFNCEETAAKPLQSPKVAISHRNFLLFLAG